MLQLEKSKQPAFNVYRQNAIWKTMVPPEVQSKEEETEKYEVGVSASAFDPTQCSPPNSFMKNLKQRMIVYYK